MGNGVSLECASFDAEEIRRLGRSFRYLDADGNGRLSTKEFLALPQLTLNPLVQRVVTIFDKDGNGELDFEEFVMGLSLFSSKADVDEEEKRRFAFKIYDLDEDGLISNADLYGILKIMVGNNLKPSQLQQLVDRCFQRQNKSADDVISFEEFCDIIKTYDITKKMVFDLQ